MRTRSGDLQTATYAQPAPTSPSTLNRRELPVRAGREASGGGGAARGISQGADQAKAALAHDEAMGGRSGGLFVSLLGSGDAPLHPWEAASSPRPCGRAQTQTPSRCAGGGGPGGADWPRSGGRGGAEEGGERGREEPRRRRGGRRLAPARVVLELKEWRRRRRPWRSSASAYPRRHGRPAPAAARGRAVRSVAGRRFPPPVAVVPHRCSQRRQPR